MAEPRADEKDSSKLWQDAFSNIDEDMVYLESKSMSVLEPLPREELGLDPVTYEIGKHRIYEILEAGRYALQRVSASPVVTEAGESMFALYTAEGHTALSASGILLHVGPSEVAIKVMLDWYSENPGIHPGDQFFINDPYISAHHAADMLIAKPIFYDGELIAWMGSLTHTPSVGSIHPGGTCVESTEIFHDGFRFPGIKIVRDHVIDNTILRFLLRASRDTRTLILDTRAKIAGNNTAEKLFLEMVDDLGAETVKKIMKQVIYESEDRARNRLRDIPDGRWRAMRLMDNIGRETRLNKMVLEVTKHGDSLKLDFTGTSPQFDGSMNCTLNNTMGLLFSDLANFLFWDSDWNKGIWHPIEIVIPKGCFIRAQFPASTATCPPTTGLVLNSIFAEIIGKMYKAAGIDYEEDINASWSAAHPNPGGGGTDQFGFPFAGVLLDSAASGTGAGAIRDGCDTGGISLFAETNSSDVEMYESKYPLLYLARREWPGSGGHGMFRGGLGGEQIVMVRNGMFRFNQLTMGEFTNITPGLFGGYPTPVNDAMIIYNPELKLDRGEVLDTWEKVKKHPKAEVIERKATTLMDGDIYANRWMGGGGYGDPLDRDPDMVREDFMEFKINPNDVEEKYGVVIDPETFRVNWEATEKLRERIKEHRMEVWTWPKK